VRERERESERERGGVEEVGIERGRKGFVCFLSERDWRERRVEDGGLAAGLSYSSALM
jgi:hypothetical protein